MKTALFFLLTLLLLVNISVFSQKREDLIKEADQLSESFDNKGSLDKCMQADKLYPKDWEINWRISRAYVNIASHLPEKTDKEKEKQLAMFELALRYAEDAVKQGSNQSITYLRRAIANGKIALFKGVFSVGGVVNSVKKDCETAIKLNTGGSYVQGLAHYILARTNAKISEKWAPARAVIGLGWADNEIAIKEYDKAISLFPNFRMFYLDYAKSLIREDKFSEARNYLNKCITSPKKEEDDDSRIVEAKKLLEEIKNE